MAFWSKDTKKEKKPGAKAAVKAVAAKAPAVAAVRADQLGASSYIIRPHVTEKSGLLAQGGVYTFVVMKGTSKTEITKAVKALYKITPTKVSMVNLPAKQIFVKGRWGTVSAMRKALVTVKKGDKIDFV